jgi:hypothetical protein
MDNYTYNIVSIFACLFALLCYLCISYSLTIFFPSANFKTHLARSTYTSILWVQKHKEKSDSSSVTLAIQTFRNTILIAVFVGGSSLSSALANLESYSFDAPLLQRIRTLIITSLLFLSFLSWANVIRFSSHLGYLTGVLGPEFSKKNAVPKNVESAQPSEVLLSVNESLDGSPEILADDDRDYLVEMEETMMTYLQLSFR